MFILADIGGTKMRIAGSRDLKSFGQPEIWDTPQTYEEGLERFVGVAKKIAGGEPVEGISLGIVGVLSPDRRMTMTTPHIKWGSRPLAADLEERLGGTAHLENDTALVGLGEATYGAGKGVAICAYFTVSTGVNGVRIVDGKIDRAAQGFEIGSQYIESNPPQTLEGLVSGSALAAKYGTHPRDLGKNWEGWEDLARLFSLGLYNSITHWSPDRVVLGGSMFNDIGIPIESVERHLTRVNVKYPALPQVVHSHFGDVGGLWGAMARLKQLS